MRFSFSRPHALLGAAGVGVVMVASCGSAGGGVSTSGGGHQGPSTGARGAGTGGASGACTLCMTTADCNGAVCAQFGGDSYCAADCTTVSCPANDACMPVSTIEGNPANVCIPVVNPCGSPATSGAGGGATSSSAGGATSSSGGADTCGVLVGPSVQAACTGCMTAGKPCQANGCWGGWWCNTSLNTCQPPPGNCGSSSSSSSSSSTTSSSTSSSSGGPGGTIGPTGGKLDTLSFAIVGDTRPPGINDTAGYPSAVANKIWNDVEAQSPRPAFAVTTGDYMFATPTSGQAAPQLNLYLQARQPFSNLTFPAMGNHECTGATTSNCGQGTANGITDNFTQFLTKMLMPLGVTKPWYVIHISSTTSAWTAKFVFVAPNAWTMEQATWLQTTLAQPTTYTFVIRHERTTANTAPGVTPSNQIISANALTLLIVGHTHTYEYQPQYHEVVVGNGGAPLTTGSNYGYVIARQRADGAMEFKEYDYATNAVNQTFAVKADGTSTP